MIQHVLEIVRLHHTDVPIKLHDSPASQVYMIVQPHYQMNKNRITDQRWDASCTFRPKYVLTSQCQCKNAPGSTSPPPGGDGMVMAPLPPLCGVEVRG